MTDAALKEAIEAQERQEKIEAILSRLPTKELGDSMFGELKLGKNHSY